MNYEIVLYYEDGVWVAEVPELTGCATHADTEEEALRQIKSLVPEWIATAHANGIAIPEPHGRLAFA